MRSIIGFILALLLSNPAFALTVGVFDNASYVDTSNGAGNESDTVQASLTSLGHSVNTFTGISSGAFSSASSSADLILIPELELTSTPELTAWSTGSKSAVQSYVSGGGGLILIGSHLADEFFNTFFDFSITAGGYSSSSSLNVANSAGTVFQGEASSLTSFSATSFLTKTSLPLSTTIFYESATGASVFSTSYGSGQITYVGWDWFDAAPLGSNDGGWLSVLDSAVSHTAAVPEPTTMLLFGTGIAGLAAVGRRRKK